MIESAVAFCSAVGRALHETGTPASRLERRMECLSAALGVPGQFSVNPTAFLAQYRIPGAAWPHAESVRVRPGVVDLARQAQIEALVDQVCAGELPPRIASERLRAIEARPNGSGALPAAAAAVVSAAAAVFLGGGVAEIAVAALGGLLIGALELVLPRRGAEERLVAPVAAFLVALGASGLGQLVSGFSLATAQVASLIVLVPGLDFTLAVKEIATSHLVSGSARLVSALGDFLLLGFGLAAGTQVAVRLFGAPEYHDPVGLPLAASLVALPLAAVGFGVRFRAHREQFPWLMLACLVARVGADVGARLLGPDLGAFVGALAVGLVANGYARRSGRSSLALMVPGLILLVPGGFGLQAMELVRRHDPISGLEAGFTMAIIATALSTGLLLANLVLPSSPLPEPWRLAHDRPHPVPGDVPPDSGDEPHASHELLVPPCPPDDVVRGGGVRRRPGGAAALRG